MPLPPIESLDGLRSDYLAFFQQPVADDLRRAALKKLFADPHFNQMDMLDVYVDDYTQFEPLPAALRLRLPSARDFLLDSERAALEAAEATTCVGRYARRFNRRHWRSRRYCNESRAGGQKPSLTTDGGAEYRIDFRTESGAERSARRCSVAGRSGQLADDSSSAAIPPGKATRTRSLLHLIRMATPGSTLKVCNCNRTMTLDGAALGRALGRDAIPIYTELCRKEVDGFTTALEAASCTVACTQEAPLFSELAAGAGASTELKFVNIREAAGWSAEGAAATAKIAALLALADLPEPQPVAISSYASKGEVLIIGPAEAAIAWAEQLAESLSVSVLITTARGAELPATRRYPVWSGMRARAVQGYLGKFEVQWEPTNPIDLEVCTRCNACIRACPEDAIDLTYQVDLTRCKSHRACVKACGAIGAIDFGRTASTRTEQFDLVFDLSAQSLLRMPEKPFGYLAPGADPLEQAQAAMRLVQMVGEFEKPRYVQYEEKLCAHSRNTIDRLYALSRRLCDGGRPLARRQGLGASFPVHGLR